MCKPLHAGTASEHGLRAARLAAKGFTARGDSLECDQGFASSQSDHLNIDAALGEPPQGWHLRNNLFKYHAACYLTHAPIECAKEIRLKSNFPPERVKKILLRIDSGADKVCNIADPTTGLEAKFSLRQTVAMALTGVDTAALDSYNDGGHAGAAHEGAARQDGDRVQARLGAIRWPRWRSSSTTARPSRRATIRASPGPTSPSSAQALETKFESLVTPVLGAAGTRRLYDAIERI